MEPLRHHCIIKGYREAQASMPEPDSYTQIDSDSSRRQTYSTCCLRRISAACGRLYSQCLQTNMSLFLCVLTGTQTCRDQVLPEADYAHYNAFELTYVSPPPPLRFPPVLAAASLPESSVLTVRHYNATCSTLVSPYHFPGGCVLTTLHGTGYTS
jgi:hypothetical protein